MIFSRKLGMLLVLLSKELLLILLELILLVCGRLTCTCHCPHKILLCDFVLLLDTSAYDS